MTKKTFAAFVVALLLAVMLAVPVLAGNGPAGANGAGGGGPGWGYGERPGWGYGDDNHSHNGPPGR